MMMMKAETAAAATDEEVSRLLISDVMASYIRETATTVFITDN